MDKGQKSILQKFATDFYLEKVFPAFREEKTQRFTTLVLTLFAISFFGFFAISPTLATIADLQKQLSDNQLVDQKLQQKIANLSTLEQQYNAIQGDLPIVFTALPQSPQAALLVADIQALLQEHHLTMQSINIATTPLAPLGANSKTATPDNAFDFTISAQGQQGDALAFLKSITSFSRIITLDGFVMNTSQKSVSDKNLPITVSLKGKAHYKPT